MIDVQGLLDVGRRSRARVGIGLRKDLVKSKAKRLVGPPSNVRIEPIDDPRRLVAALKKGSIDAAVRGTLSSAKVIEELKREFSLDEVMRTAVLEGVRGKQFLLTPVGIDEGIDAASRLRLVSSTVAYFGAIGWNLKIGVLSKGRFEDRSRSKEIRQSLDDGEGLVETLRKRGLRAEHYGILIEDAVENVDLVVAPDGVSGNLIFRSLTFLGGGKAYGAPVVNLKRVFIDTSRAKADFFSSIMLAGGLASSMAGLQELS